MKWMEYLEDPIAIIMNSIWLAPSDAHIRVAQLLADQKWLYSPQYFDVVDGIMKNQQTPKLVVRTLENFFELIQVQKQVDNFVLEESMLFYNALE